MEQENIVKQIGNQNSKLSLCLKQTCHNKVLQQKTHIFSQVSSGLLAYKCLQTNLDNNVLCFYFIPITIIVFQVLFQILRQTILSTGWFGISFGISKGLQLNFAQLRVCLKNVT